jgi:hypothetical protein
MKYISFLLGSLVIVSCNSQPSREQEKSSNTPSTFDSTKVAIVKEVKSGEYDQIARFLAGMPQREGSSIKSLEENPDWQKFHTDFDSMWMKLKKTRLNQQEQWASSETKAVDEKVSYLFYPFSGADYLNANIFFPSVKKTVMIGLEPAGSAPNVKKFETDSLNRYFKSIRKSLNSILKFSFYRTNSMAKDFKTVEMDGTLPNVLIFMARRNLQILNIEPLVIDKNSQLMVKKASDFKKPTYQGVRVTYQTEGSNESKELYYFSADISDQGLEHDAAFLGFLQAQTFDATYLKSASYLMHKAYFSTIRNIILKQTKFLLQDDSGIPFRFFNDGSWNIQVYGTYDRPIKLFSNYFQKDFKAAYSDSTKVRALPFGIGYDWHINESNLMMAEKNGAHKTKPSKKSK